MSVAATTPAAERSPSGPWPRRAARAVVGVALLLAIVLALLGRLTRDPVVPLAFLLYAPLALFAAAALAFDLLARGRSLPGPRFGLAGAALLGLGFEAAEMLAWPGADEPGGGGPEIRVLHWNIQWGGRDRADRREAARRAILDHAPDIALLNEVQDDAWVERLRAELDPAATAVFRHQPAGSPYWYGLVVCSKWPATFEEDVALAHGAGLIVRVAAPDGDLRILLVDGQSNPALPRGGFLRDIVATCGRRRLEGRPVDLIAGDFNCVARNLGFEEIGRGGYRLASRRCGGWRGTFPASLPLYDIDHVWVAREARGLRCATFGARTSDHRGQLVRFRRPKAEAAPGPAEANEALHAPPHRT